MSDSKWEDCHCGSTRFVAQQPAREQLNKRGEKEMALGPEEVYCKKCGAPAVEREAEDGDEPQVLVGVPKHLQGAFDEGDHE